jgi:hypothetical protein
MGVMGAVLELSYSEPCTFELLFCPSFRNLQMLSPNEEMRFIFSQSGLQSCQYVGV